jgi:hypothetical protein
MAISLRGSTSPGGGVIAAIPDTELALIVRDGSPDTIRVVDFSSDTPNILSGGYDFSGTGDVQEPLIYGTKAYVFDNNAASSRLHSFDISDAANGNISLYSTVTVYDNPTTYGSLVDGQYAYMCTSNSYFNPQVIHIYDISDPNNMFHKSQTSNNTALSGPTRAMFYPDGDYIIVIKNNTGVVADISNKAAPFLAYTMSASLFTQGQYYWAEVAKYGSDSYLFMGYNTSYVNFGIEVYNITDPDPSTWTVEQNFVENTYRSGAGYFKLVGQYIYCSCNDGINNWVTMVDASDVTNLAVVDQISRSASMNSNTFVQQSGGQAIYVHSYADNGATVAYNVPVKAYKFAGTISDDATVYVLNSNNFQIARQKNVSAGSYNFPAVTDQQPYHVMAERDSDGALLIYADVTPTLYSEV